MPAPSTPTGRQGLRRERYKRPFDLLAIALAFVMLLPLWLLLAVAIPVAIRLEDGGPVLYRQARLGRGGRVFRILKFRSMVEGAEERTGPVWAARRDPRSTAVGRVLRRFHLDELPQVLNVLRGEMSLVGPRPERPALAARFERRHPGFERRVEVRPGIAGLAQARGRLEPYGKLCYDRLYIRRMNPWLDVKLLLACAWRALRGPGSGVGPRRATRRPEPTRVAEHGWDGRPRGWVAAAGAVPRGRRGGPR